MSSPPLKNKFDQADKILASPLYMFDNSWPLPEDRKIFLAVEDYADGDFDQNIFEQENSSISEDRFNEALPENRVLEHHNYNIISSVPREASANPCLFIQDNANCCELNSFLETKNHLPTTEPITARGLLANNNHEDNGLSTILKPLESLCPILEERSMPSIKRHENTEKFDPRTYLEQESSAMEPCFYGELAQEHSFNNCNESNLSNCFEASVNSLQILDQQETSALASSTIDKGLLGELELKDKTKEKKNKLKRLQIDKEKDVQLYENDGAIAKKQQHNAKEKVRRMTLNASYLALGALLPADSRNEKKRSSAPAIIDRTLVYIPELENEIRKLTLMKNNLLSTVESEQNPSQNPCIELEAPTISVHEVVKGEVIIQIVFIMKNKDSVFSKLLQNLEAEGMSIVNASTFQVCKERVCYNLHIQTNGSLLAADNVAVLREKMSSCLC